MKSLGRPIFEQSQNVTWKPISSVRPPCPPNHNDICHRNGLPRRNLSSRRLESECDFALSCVLDPTYFSVAKYERNELSLRMIETRIIRVSRMIETLLCGRTISGCVQTSHKHFLSTSTVPSELIPCPGRVRVPTKMVDCADCYKLMNSTKLAASFPNNLQVIVDRPSPTTRIELTCRPSQLCG